MAEAGGLPPITRAFEPRLIFPGDIEPEPVPMLVEGLVPTAEVVILAGVYSAGKTFVAADLAAAVMKHGAGYLDDFAGRLVLSGGGVLWIAAEGAGEIDARMKAALEAREMPWEGASFARTMADVPVLTDPKAYDQLRQLIRIHYGKFGGQPSGRIRLVVIDTLGSAAGFKDGNSSPEAQGVFNMLRRISRDLGVLVLVVDHFGKVVETGVMGASAKSQSADAVLAVLCDKDPEGNITNRRLVLHKARSGAGGGSIPFELRVVPAGRSGGTTCVVDWKPAQVVTAARRPPKSPWTGKGKLLKTAIEKMLKAHGENVRPLGEDAPEMLAVRVDKVRAEFKASFAGDNEATKGRTFRRELALAVERRLITTREIGEDAADWVWFGALDDSMKEIGPRTGRTKGTPSKEGVSSLSALSS